ncbi:hypothetical protein IQ247_08350 [Plectonema cf. radiosum LEGE 06105]|uniref:Uncharacterized protein n=1 Tax=Plectonema cf. radiosum LEGE 06105 TaxID=945769 RepID=A0A8J7F154_9CYAN|nr:hypothetical protein [Plectonema radiosum]MBE9212700.1 hypothetical protein [Plectonema cf. radiosum LEGE 06105]
MLNVEYWLSGVDMGNHPGVWMQVIIRGCGCRQSSGGVDAGKSSGDVDASNHPGMWMQVIIRGWGFSCSQAQILAIHSFDGNKFWIFVLKLCTQTKQEQKSLLQATETWNFVNLCKTM